MTAYNYAYNPEPESPTPPCADVSSLSLGVSQRSDDPVRIGEVGGSNPSAQTIMEIVRGQGVVGCMAERHSVGAGSTPAVCSNVRGGNWGSTPNHQHQTSHQFKRRSKQK